jgi:transcription elongation factor
MDDKLTVAAQAAATVTMHPNVGDALQAEGVYVFECYGPDGVLKWRETIDNTVVTVGKNAMLDAALAGSAYTVTGPYMGLISSTSYSAISASDTMASHAGWLEAGGSNTPTYTGNRQTCAWSAASGGAKALSVALSYTMTGSGTLKGAFITYGSGAVATKDNTSGTLFSAGLFTGGDRAVLTSDVVNVSYSVSL